MPNQSIYFLIILISEYSQLQEEPSSHDLLSVSLLLLISIFPLFQYYRLAVIREIARKIEKAEKLILIKAMKRKEDREKKVLLAAENIQKSKLLKNK